MLGALHTMAEGREAVGFLCMLEYEYFITYFQPISLDSQQSLATHFHGLSVWTAIV